MISGAGARRLTDRMRRSGERGRCDSDASRVPAEADVARIRGRRAPTGAGPRLRGGAGPVAPWLAILRVSRTHYPPQRDNGFAGLGRQGAGALAVPERGLLTRVTISPHCRHVSIRSLPQYPGIVMKSRPQKNVHLKET